MSAANQIISGNQSQIITHLENKSLESDNMRAYGDTLKYELYDSLGNIARSTTDLTLGNVDAGMFRQNLTFSVPRARNLTDLSIKFSGTCSYFRATGGLNPFSGNILDAVESIELRDSSSTIQYWTGEALLNQYSFMKGGAHLEKMQKMTDVRTGEVIPMATILADDGEAGVPWDATVIIPTFFSSILALENSVYAKPLEQLFVVVNIKDKASSGIPPNGNGTTQDGLVVTLFQCKAIVDSFEMDSETQMKYNKKFLAEPYSQLCVSTVTSVYPLTATVDGTFKEIKINCTNVIISASAFVVNRTETGARKKGLMKNVKFSISGQAITDRDLSKANFQVDAAYGRSVSDSSKDTIHLFYGTDFKSNLLTSFKGLLSVQQANDAALRFEYVLPAGITVANAAQCELVVVYQILQMLTVGNGKVAISSNI